MMVKTTFDKETAETSYILDFEKCIHLEATTEEYNVFILEQFYKAVEWLLLKGFDEYIELECNTINVCHQNAFVPLRVYRVLKNGHYKIFKIHTRCFGGILIMETVKNITLVWG